LYFSVISLCVVFFAFFFSSRRRHTRSKRDWSSDVCSSDLSWITARQIEAARIAMTRYMKRGGKVWINIFPHTPYTKKPLEVRMGSGKGAIEGWIAVVKPGRVMFEVAGVEEEVAKEALRLASHKLPLKTKVVKREELGGDTNES